MSTFENAATVRRQEFTCTEEELSLYPDKVLAKNELLYVRMNDGTIRVKMGDGRTRVYDLGFIKLFDGSVANDLGNSNTMPISQGAVTKKIVGMEKRMISYDGIFSPEFELGVITIAEDGSLAYSASTVNIRTVEGGLYKVPQGSSFTLSDYTVAKLLMRVSYDDGKTFTGITRTASIPDAVVMAQDAVVTIVIQSATNTKQHDTSLAELLVVDIDTSLDKATAPNLNTSGQWEMGTFYFHTGENGKATDKARMMGYIPETVEKINLNGYATRLFAWDADGTYVGYWDGSSFQTTNTSLALQREININAFREIYPGYQFRLVANMTSIAEAEKIEFYNKIYSAMYDVKTRKPMVTFVDDDGWEGSIDNWVEIANETGVRPTFALVTSDVGNDGYPSWDKILHLWNRGFDFISHSHQHIRLSDQTNDVIEANFANTQAAFREHGMKAEFIAYPENAYNRNVMKIAKRYFKGAVCGNNKENYPPIVPHGLHRQSVTDGTLTEMTFADGTKRSVYGYKSEAELASMIDAVVKNNGWVIFMTHIRDAHTFYYNDDVKQMLINLIKYATKSGCEIVTLSEGYEKYKNRLDAGIYGWDSNYCVVDCDGRVYESISTDN